MLLGPQVGRVHKRSHDLDIAMHNQCLIGPVRVDADAAMVEDGVWQLCPLPQNVTVTLKLAWIRGLWQVGSGSVLELGELQGPEKRRTPQNTLPSQVSLPPPRVQSTTQFIVTTLSHLWDPKRLLGVIHLHALQ